MVIKKGLSIINIGVIKRIAIKDAAGTVGLFLVTKQPNSIKSVIDK